VTMINVMCARENTGHMLLQFCANADPPVYESHLFEIREYYHLCLARIAQCYVSFILHTISVI
jgi:hypothetical protein